MITPRPRVSALRKLAGWLEGWETVCFVLSLCLLAFLYGLAAGVYKIFPYSAAESLAEAGVDWVEYPAHNAGLRPSKFLSPAEPAGSRLVTHVPEKAYEGVTFIEGFFGESLGLQLLDMDGRVIHEWHVAFNEIWPEAPHLEKKPDDWDTQIHGSILYPNGDVIFNFQYGGLVRIDECSRVQWQLSHMTHHSIYEASDGNLWVPGRQTREESVPRFPKIPPPFEEELILEISPDGRILRQISVLDVIFRSGYEGVLFSNGAHEAEIQVPLGGDFAHLNDIEILEPPMAAAFPLFEPGDIMISLRNLNLLLVIDGKSERVKWSQTGPYLRQHDPDFLPNGRISIFDNRRDGAEGTVFGGSRILELDPTSGQAITVYGGNEEEMFYTETMGDHQRLPNGNILITESKPGRVFEDTAQGERVWSFINLWDEDEAALVSRAIRYPEGYADFAESSSCD
jgi:hypothetical protein